MDIISELRNFYDHEADKFHETRKKPWPEFGIILDEIKSSGLSQIKVLELGCGAGRFCSYLRDNLDIHIDYTGVDISSNLIQIAQRENPDQRFVVDDMDSFLAEQGQQEYDFVIAIASFQHLGDVKSREVTLKNIYRTLKYNGKLIMINWSFSDWFISKYKKDLIKSLLKSIILFGISKYNDVYVPWIDNDRIFYRYYHIFTLLELKSLIKLSSFVIQKLCYVDKTGVTTHIRKNSRNSLVVASKDVSID